MRSTSLIVTVHRGIRSLPMPVVRVFVVALTCAISAADLLTPSYIVFIGTYLLPIYLAAWYCDVLTLLFVTGMSFAASSYVFLQNFPQDSPTWQMTFSAVSIGLVGIIFALTNLRLKKAFRKLRELTRIDPLTELSNRRDFDEKAHRELERTKRFNTPLSVVMLDIDHFKRVNDTYGHDAGDAVLKKLSVILREGVRGIDVTARIGGEEFAILMPGTTQQMATETAQRLRHTVSKTEIGLADGRSIVVTVSMGVSSFGPDDATMNEMMHRADRALYAAKQSGRNRVLQAA